MKKVTHIISTDWHVTPENGEQILELVQQQCTLAKELGVKTLICLGDVFERRESQRLSTLKVFEKILKLIHSSGLELIAIPGNHDKTLYTSCDSFLDPFKNFPGFTLITENTILTDEDRIFCFIPFFETDIWSEEFKKLNEKLDEKLDDMKFSQSLFLFSHMAVDGSMNNDGTKVESRIKPSLFKSFDKVLLGHYHNSQQIGENIFHLPSIQQNNYGEDQDKGFTLLYSDGSVELVQSDFTKYYKKNIDVDKLSKKEIREMVDECSEWNHHVRFVLQGSQINIDAVDKTYIRSKGIDVKTKTKEITDSIEFVESNEIMEYKDQDVLEFYNEFCENEGLDRKVGLKYLKKVIE